jgi:FkbM family methyltransferase
MIDAQAQRTFERRVAFFHKPRLAKLAGAPLRLMSSAVVQGLCRATGKPRARRVRTFWGQDMKVVYPDSGSISLAHYGFVEEGLTSLVMRLLKPGMTFFDVGGHYGYFSLLGSTLVGPQGQVHTFEPTPRTLEVLRANTAAVANVRVNDIALSSEEGELTFQDFGAGFSEYNTLTAEGRLDDQTRRRLQPKQLKVRARRMDNYVRESGAKPDFVKIDAEGAELQILMGMTQVMETIKPMITIEVAPDPGDVPGGSAKSVKFLEEHGYLAHEWVDGQIRRHEPKASYTYDNLLFVHRDGPGVG